VRFWPTPSVETVTSAMTTWRCWRSRPPWMRPRGAGARGQLPRVRDAAPGAAAGARRRPARGIADADRVFSAGRLEHQRASILRRIGGSRAVARILPFRRTGRRWPGTHRVARAPSAALPASSWAPSRAVSSGPPTWPPASGSRQPAAVALPRHSRSSRPLPRRRGLPARFRGGGRVAARRAPARAGCVTPNGRTTASAELLRQVARIIALCPVDLPQGPRAEGGRRADLARDYHSAIVEQVRKRGSCMSRARHPAPRS